MDFYDGKDYISDMDCDKEGRHLLCTSGDGILSVYDLRKKQLLQQSDQLDEELLSVSVMKNGNKVVCGSSSGTLNIYSWGEWGDVSDRIPTNHESIEAICKVTEDIVCTGSDDGKINALFIKPHRAIGVLGSHSSYSIDNLRLSRDGKMVASCSGDGMVKFWDVSNLHEETIEPIQQKKGHRKRKLDETSKSADDFFADL